MMSDLSPRLDALRADDGRISAATRFRLAVATFEHTAQYDGAIAQYLGAMEDTGQRQSFPRTWNSQHVKKQPPRARSSSASSPR